MPGTVGRSTRGEIVDFDAMRIKQQLADAPKAIEVKAREEMITAKRKRRKVKPEETGETQEPKKEEK